MAQHKGFPNFSQPPSMKFNGNDLLDPQQRYNHGMSVAIPQWNLMSPSFHFQKNNR